MAEMKEERAVQYGFQLPGWMRALSIIAGIIAIILAIIVLVYPTVGIATLITLLALGLLLIGIDRLAIGISGTPLY